MLAIIPARGGSNGLPGKNIKLLTGKPLIAYTIEAAKKSESITRIFVSTDDESIAKIAKQYGAECDELRPDFLATDEAKSIDLYKYLIKKFTTGSNKIEAFVVLQPTSPLRLSQHIDEAVELFEVKNADSVISFCEEHHPIVWHKHIDREGKPIEIFENRIKNRQDERVTYFPNGSIYVFKSKIIYDNRYYTNKTYAYIMNRNASVDIDTIEDFEYAEYLISKNSLE